MPKVDTGPSLELRVVVSSDAATIKLRKLRSQMFYQRLVWCLCLLVLTSCGGQGSYSGPPSGTFVVNVTVSGLPINGTAQVVVQNNGVDSLSFINNGTQSFPYQQIGSGYNVSILTQPSPLNCVVSPATGSNPINVNVNCSEQFVYVTNYASSKLSVLSVGAGGILTQLSLVSTGQNPTSVAVHPNGKFAYVSNYSSSTISVYGIQNGTLSTPYSVATGAGPFKIVISPNGSYLYCVNINAGTVTEYAIASGGGLTQVTGSPLTIGVGINSIAVDPTSSFVYVSGGLTNSTVYEYQIQSNGSLSFLGSTTTGISAPTSVVVSPGGKFAYVINSTANNASVFSIGAGGQLTFSSTAATGLVPHDIAFTPNGSYAYVTNYGGTLNPGTSLTQYQVNTSTGALSQMTNPTVTAGQTSSAGPYSIVVDAIGYSVFNSNYNESSISQYVISSTGALNVASPTFTTNISSPTSIALH